MKKFVGLVNGKSFDNVEDFNKAAEEAMKSNDDSLSISSYYSYSNKDDGDDRKLIEFENDGKFVSTSEYFLGDRKPDVVNGNDVEYQVSDALIERLKNASNKDGIKNNLRSHIHKLNKTIRIYEDKSKDLQNDIEKLQNSLYENENSLKDFVGKKKYYNNLLEIVAEDSDDTKESNDNNPPVEEKKEFTKEDIKKIVGIDPEMSLYSFLKQLGLLK